MVICQGQVKTRELSQIQLCKFSILFLKFPIIILLYVYIHDISSDLVFIMHLFYFGFLIFLFVDLFV